MNADAAAGIPGRSNMLDKRLPRQGWTIYEPKHDSHDSDNSE